MSSCSVFPLLVSLLSAGKTAVVVYEKRGLVEVRSLIVDGTLVVGSAGHLQYYPEAMEKGRVVVEREGVKIVAERIDPGLPLVVVGSGNISRVIALTAKEAGFVTVYLTDSRVRPEGVLTNDLSTVEQAVNNETAVVVANEGGREYDVDVVDKALRKGAWYVGLMASKTRAKMAVEELLRRGHNRDDLKSRLHTPAGLDIGSRTPGEIAISILSEVVALKRGGTFRPMSEVKSPWG